MWRLSFLEVQVSGSTCRDLAEYYARVLGNMRFCMNWFLNELVSTLLTKDGDSIVLTKDLVRYQIKGDTITPDFINPDDINLLSVAEELLEIFSGSQGKTRNQLLEESQIVIQNSPCVPVIVRGIQKLLLDRTEFDADPNEELTQFRQELFTQTSQLLSTELFTDFADYQQRVQKEFQLSLDEIRIWDQNCVRPRGGTIKTISKERSEDILTERFANLLNEHERAIVNRAGQFPSSEE